MLKSSIVKIERQIDRHVGSLICLFLSPFNLLKRKKIILPKNILIIKLWGIGESILTLPMIRLLRRKFFQAKIDLLCRDRNKDVYFGNKDIDNILTLESSNLLKLIKKYDLAIDCEPYLNFSSIVAFFLAKKVLGFSHGLRSLLYDFKIKYNDRQHVVYTYVDLLKPFGIKQKPKKLVPLAYTKKDERRINNLLKKFKIKKNDILFGFCCGAAESAKSRIWPAERFAKLAEKIIKMYKTKIILIGSKKEKLLNEKVKNLVNEKYKKNILNFAGLTNLKELFCLIKKCKIFVSNDTGPMHIAAAQGCKTIGLFCPNTPVRFGPFGKNNFSIYKPVLSKPCINVHLGQIPDCKHQHMINIRVEDVLDMINKIMKK